MAIDKFNWKAIGIGVLIAFLIGLVPLIGFIGYIVGGFAAVYLAKITDKKTGMVYGTITGGLSAFMYGIVGLLIIRGIMSEALSNLGGSVNLGLGALSVLVLIVLVVAGIVLGLIGGLIGAALRKK